MTTTVIVVAHRPHEWLRACLASVVDQTDELIVVDNGSPGDAIATAARDVGARVVRRAENAGFPAGVNAGVAAARGDVIALLNDDAFAGPDWLAGAGDVLRDPTIAAVSPKLLYAARFAEVVVDDPAHSVAGDARPLGRMIHSITVDGTERLAAARGPGLHALESGPDGAFRWTAGAVPFLVPLDGDHGAVAVDGEPATVRRVVDVVNSAGSFLQRDGYAGDIGDGQPDGPEFDEPADRFSLCGAAMAFRRDTWARVGPFAAEFFAYYEDTDWCWRAQRAGLRLRYDPTTVVRHVGGATTGGQQDPRMRLLSARNRILCLVRNAPAAVARAHVSEVLLHESRFNVPGLRSALLRQLPSALSSRAARHRAGPTRMKNDVWSRWAGEVG